MFIDASAIVAILAREADRDVFVDQLIKCDTPFVVSPLVRIESILALSRLRASSTAERFFSERSAEDCGQLYDKFTRGVGAEEMELSADIGRAAVGAYALFGKGTGHPAKLNLVDCFSYACAKKLGTGLLYKGDDFAHTDLA